MKIIKYVPAIDIQLSNGVYTFHPQSGTGKTYLAKLFTKYRKYGERVNSYTYGSEVPLKSIFDSDKYDAILLDRYDMYYGECIDEIKEFSKKGIVLIDCKRYIPEIEETTCFVRINDDGSVVVFS